MKFVYVVLVVFVFFSIPAHAQTKESFNRVYNTQTIYQFGNKYMKDNQPLTYQQLGAEFTTSRTQDMYRISRKKLFISRMFSVASLAAIITNIFVKTNTAGSIGFAVGTGLLGGGSLYFQTESSKYVQRALWERNSDVLNTSQ